MKRTRLERHTPLRQGKPLARNTPLRNGPVKPRRSNSEAGSVGASPQKAKGSRSGPVKARSESTHIPEPIRAAVLARDEYMCARCSDGLRASWYSLHHRRRRGAGGSKMLHTMANLVALCGTGTSGCHGHIESNRRESYAIGWLVPNGVAPEQWPVFRHGQWAQPGKGWAECEPHPRQLELLGEAA